MGSITKAPFVRGIGLPSLFVAQQQHGLELEMNRTNTAISMASRRRPTATIGFDPAE